MKIKQRNTELFAPFVSWESNVVTDSVEEPGTGIHRNIQFEQIVGSTAHYEFTLNGVNLDGLVIHSQSANAFNLDDFPVMKRNGDFGIVEVYFKNSRGISRRHQFSSYDFSYPTYFTNAIAEIPGSYAEYSWNRIDELFSQLDGPNMYIEGSYDRKYPEIIPHSELTGHAYHSYGWGSISSGPMWGRRPIAITKRHVICAGHYTNNDIEIGDQLAFKTEDNVLLNRTVSGKLDFLDHAGVDMCMYLLNEDLPETIKPALVAGQWLKNVISTTDTHFTQCAQFYCIIVTNNYGHIIPSQQIFKTDWVSQNATFTIVGTGVPSVDGTQFSLITGGAGGGAPVTKVGFPDYNYYLGTKFNHAFIGGDSGSPIFAPVANGGWALCGMVSGFIWNPTTLNLMISKCDAVSGVSTGYTVTEAASPI